MEAEQKNDSAVAPLALRAKEAAQALGIGERKLWSLTNSGEIPHLRIGTAVVYPVHLLREWLDDRVQGRSKDRSGGGA